MSAHHDERPLFHVRPSRARFGVAALLCTLFFVLYLDRVCISQAVPAIKADLGLSDTRMSFVLMAFTLAYGLFEVPTGHWGDRLGARAVLTRIVVWWSAFTALTAVCTGFYALVLVRFLFGAGEAGAFPNTARVIPRWFPHHERGRIQGLVLASSLIGGAAAPVLAGYLISAFGWRWAFVCFGSVGLVWAVAFVRWFRDDPAHHPSVNVAERNLLAEQGLPMKFVHEPIPWRAALHHPSLWLLGAIVTCGAFNSYFYISWYPNYLQTARGVELREAGWLSGLVLAGGAAGILGGGVVVDRLARRGRALVRSRRWRGCALFILAAVLLHASVACDSPVASALFAAASYLSVMGQQATWWSCATEVGGRHVGALYGLMNSLGVPGALASQYFFSAFSDWRGAHGYTGREQQDPAFVVYVGMLLVGGLCWLFVDASRPVEATSGVKAQ